MLFRFFSEFRRYPEGPGCYKKKSPRFLVYGISLSVHILVLGYVSEILFFSRQSIECKLLIEDQFVYRRIYPQFFVDHMTFTVEIIQPTVSLGWRIPSTTWDRTWVRLFWAYSEQSITTYNSVIRSFFYLSLILPDGYMVSILGRNFFRLPNTFLEFSCCDFINSAKNCLF